MGKLSILGMYNYRPDIFDGLVLPTAADLNPDIEYVSPLPDLNREDVISTICFNLAELSLIYPEPETLKAAIALWSRKNRWSWRDLWATVCYKYNPIWNKDGSVTEERQIVKSGEESRSTAGSSTMTTAGSEEGQIVDSGEWDESRDKTVSGSHNLSGTVVDDGSTTESRSTSGGITKNEQNLHSVTGFDTDTLSPSYNDGLTGNNTTSETVSGSGTNDNTRTSQESGQTAGTEHEEAGGTNGNRRTSAGTNTEESRGTTSGSEAGSHEEATAENYRRVERGNIGVTTTQTMIKEAREIAMFNIYDVIAESFKENFCLMVY